MGMCVWINAQICHIYVLEVSCRQNFCFPRYLAEFRYVTCAQKITWLIECSTHPATASATKQIPRGESQGRESPALGTGKWDLACILAGKHIMVKEVEILPGLNNAGCI